jgi:hypothetical protein
VRINRLFRRHRNSREVQRPPRFDDDSTVVAVGDFDPRASAERQSHVPLRRMGVKYWEPPETYFLGRWEQRHPLNVPGPFYGAETDTCCDGPPLAPASLMVDEEGVRLRLAPAA